MINWCTILQIIGLMPNCLKNIVHFESLVKIITSTPHKINSSDLVPLKNHGFSNLAIHEKVQIIGYFIYINRVADELRVMPKSFTHSLELSVPYESS